MTPFAKAVADLGDTPEQVTEVLRAKGIKGHSRLASSCPIAKYLNGCGFSTVTVATHAHRYQSAKEHFADETIPLPQGVRDWIIGFDDGKYPEFRLE